MKTYPTRERILACLRYDNGKLYWLQRPREDFSNDARHAAFNTLHAGKEAGMYHEKKGGDRWLIGLDGKVYRRHQLVWIIHRGALPQMIDHANRNSTDDRIENLRAATKTLNNANSKKPKTNTSGYKGVFFDKNIGMWKAKINVNKRQIYLGNFGTIEDAAAAYAAAAKEHFGVFANSG